MISFYCKQKGSQVCDNNSGSECVRRCDWWKKKVKTSLQQLDILDI